MQHRDKIILQKIVAVFCVLYKFVLMNYIQKFL